VCERAKAFHGLGLTDRFSYGPLLLQPRYNAIRAVPRNAIAEASPEQVAA
jgi:hypothetical protein